MKEEPRFKNKYGGTFVGRCERLDVWLTKIHGREVIHCRPSDNDGLCYTASPHESLRDIGVNPRHVYPELCLARVMALDFLRDPSISPNAGQKHG